MIKVEEIDTYAWEAAIRGMRNPKNSWDRSDSECMDYFAEGELIDKRYQVGPNDLDLMKRLFKAGTEHRKYLRMIQVTMDITAPLYWWKEYDTYKVGTVANSCSTMHKLTAKKFEESDFSFEKLQSTQAVAHAIGIVTILNKLRDEYLATKNKDTWYELIQLLPTSYNQKRTVSFNYENAVTWIRQRSGHKLTEWREFVAILRSLPYIEELLADEGN